MSDYKFWNKALINPEQIGHKLPVHENDPQLGFYRMRDRDGGDMVPVAIWYDGGLLAKAGEKMVDPINVWSFCCRYPVTHKDYTDVVNGKGWKDSPPDLSEETKKDESASVSKDHNKPESDFERLTLEFNSEKELVEEFLKTPITSQEQAAKVANWTKRIAIYATDATNFHTVEKAPHLKAGRDVDNKWRELKEEPKALADKLKKHLTPWLQKQAAEEAERQRLAREKAAALQREAEAAALKAQDTSPNPDDPAQIEAQRVADQKAEELRQAQRETKPQTTNAGRTGSKVTLREFTSGLVEDYEKALEALKDHPEMKELVQTLADRSARAGVAVNGVKIVKEKRAV